MRTIAVREGEELAIPEGVDRARYAEQLRCLSDLARFKLFSFRRHTIRAAAVVGTITCGGFRIEMRPKASAGDGAGDRRFLLNLLRFAGYLKTYHPMHGQVSESGTDPIELLIGEVARDIEAGLRRGIPRRYELRNERSVTLRGRIDFTRLSTLLPGEQLRMPVHYAPLAADNRLTRLIRWSAQTLLGMTRSLTTRERLLRALTLLHDVDTAGFSRTDVEELVLSRFETKWERILTLARLLARNRSLDPTTAGDTHGTAFVFPLEGLFERSLRRLLPATLANEELTVSHHTDELYMLESTDGRGFSVRIRPDFIYRRGQAAVAVADAKWKLLIENAPSFGVDAGDIHQIDSYLSRYGIDTALLLFPRALWMAEGWSHTYRIPGTDRRIHFVSIDLESLVSERREVRQVALAGLGRTMRRLVPAAERDVTISLSSAAFSPSG